MAAFAQFHTYALLATAKRYRRLLIATAISLATSLILLGFITYTQSHGRQALQNDTQTILTQAGGQLLRALLSRRGTLTMVRDTVSQSPDLNAAQLKSLGNSAVNHTRHLLGMGSVAEGQIIQWWRQPSRLSRPELNAVDSAIAKRMQQNNSWKAPGTFVAGTNSAKPILIMTEPLRGSASRRVVFGVFSLNPLLQDFFTSGVLQDFPVQLLDDTRLLYRSPRWVEATPGKSTVIVERNIPMDSVRWTLQMQPGTNRVNQTLSWLTVAVGALSVIAGLGFTLIVWILAARTWILQRAVTRRTAALRRSLQRVRQLATTDELTGLYNRRFFLRRWIWECDRAKRYHRPLACLMIDVNGFKQVNDRLGHLTGDLILKSVAQELQTLLRHSDIVARFGGDEFVIALPETTLEHAEIVVEKIKQVRIAPPVANSGLPAVSLSVGASHFGPDKDSPEGLIEAADQDLYASKLQRKREAAASTLTAVFKH